MFNLEQSILEWRRHMFEAGVKNPNILDELESHLRDEIEQQKKSSLSKADAFQVAVEKIGKARPLQKEFKKVEKSHQIIRAIVLVSGWLATGCALFYSVVDLYVEWNFFSFSPEWNLTSIWSMLGILVALTAIWFLEKASRDKASRAGSLLVCVLFVGLALLALRPEPPSGGGGFLGRSESSPIWFRGALASVLCVPGAFWFWWMWRHLSEKSGSARGNQQVHSD